MNNICTDIGYSSLIKFGEELCGDRIEIVETNENNSTVVLADGLGSGVKANILSTLTSKIISTMMSQGIDIENCVNTIAATLPVCSTREIAYSTFSIINIINGEFAEIIQYDNPEVILLRNGENVEYTKETINIEGKKILKSKIRIYEGDVLFVLSDGALYASLGKKMNFGWERKDVINYMIPFYHVGFTAKTLTKILLDECNNLYGGKPGDDTTVCTIKIRRRSQINLIIGPPSNPDDCNKMMSLFFSKEGKHIVCGGTTSVIAAEFLGRNIISNMDYFDPEIPPTGYIEGVDLVTEGILTMNKVLENAIDYLADNEQFKYWSYKNDGASQISKLLFEESTDINFYVGKAVNPAHQNPLLPINFSVKMQLVDELSTCLKQIGKRIKVSYF